MTPRERLMCTLQGRPVDRPAVSFYELNGLDENPSDPDPFNIFSHPSWRPLIELAREKTDRIVLRGVAFKEIAPDPIGHLATDETWDDSQGRRFTRHTITAGRRTLRMQTRRDRDINTVWTTEHLLKDLDDLDAFLELPVFGAGESVDPTAVLKVEAALGDTGIAMIDTPDPLCLAALLFDLGQYTVIAMTEPERFHRLLERFSEVLLGEDGGSCRGAARPSVADLWAGVRRPAVSAAAIISPVRLPLRDADDRDHPPQRRLRPNPFSRPTRRTFWTTLRRWAPTRSIRSSRRRRATSNLPTSGGATAGNSFFSATWRSPTSKTCRRARFAEKVKRALDEGTAGDGRGFVLMPSASPYGRKLSLLALKNYETIVRVAAV